MSNMGLLWKGSSRHCRPFKKGVDSNALVSYRVFTVGLENIEEISAVRLFVPKDIHPESGRQSLAKSMIEVQRRFPEGVPLLHPVQDMNVKSVDFTKLSERSQALKDRLSSHILCSDYTEDERRKMICSQMVGRKID